jgi:hypothetical protein
MYFYSERIALAFGGRRVGVMDMRRDLSIVMLVIDEYIHDMNLIRVFDFYDLQSHSRAIIPLSSPCQTLPA